MIPAVSSTILGGGHVTRARDVLEDIACPSVSGSAVVAGLVAPVGYFVKLAVDVLRVDGARAIDEAGWCAEVAVPCWTRACKIP